MRRVRLIALLVVASLTLPAIAEAQRRPRTPAGWRVTPVGESIRVPRTSLGFQGPQGAALSPGGQKLLTVSSGIARNNSTDLFDLRRRERTGSVTYDAQRGGAVFYGVVWSPDGKHAWASGGGQNVVHAYRAGQSLRQVADIPVPNFPAGIAYGRTPRGRRLYVANNLAGTPAGTTNPPGRTVTVIDTGSNSVVNTIDLGTALQPMGIVFERRNRKAYVTQWMGRSVTVIDANTETAVKRIVLSPSTDPLDADHPSAIAANPVRDEVYTANANSDTVSVINTRADTVVATIDVSLSAGALEGANPNALAVSPSGRRLYVSLGGENAIAIVDLHRRKVIGLLPTSWYPTDVEVTPGGGRLVLTTANNVRANPARCIGPYAIGDCTTGDLAYTAAKSKRPSTKGAVTIVKVPRNRRVQARLTRTVKVNNRLTARRRAKPRHLDAIKHVIYVIKENRTYDQVLGDLRAGRGDSSLTLFRESSAPNHHELARRFTLLDNFYADADVSADGHSWAAAAGVTDYTSKTWPITYSAPPRRLHRARDFEQIGTADQYLTQPLPFDLSVFRGPAAPVRGYLWDNAQAQNVSYRVYGEYTKIPGDCHGDGNVSEVTHLDDRRFGDHVDERYAGFNLDCSDHLDREPEWERELQMAEETRAATGVDPLPALQIVRLPNDHTAGTKPGYAIPEAYMADNDYALGKMVEALTKSSFWESTVMLVTEDDAQNGPDHVDAHRTLAYAISPYTQRRRTDHTHYHTAAMVATIEDLLGLPPMTIVDQRAARMWPAFNRTPNFATYKALRPIVTPFGAEGAQLNEDSAPLARASASWNFRIEDATPEIPLNEAIWKSVRGRDSEMPAPRHDLIVGQRPVDPGG
jgi:YVTN family beta-propeller protein